MADFDDIPECALAWKVVGKGAALATVVETWGSAPRQAGAQLAVSSDGEIMGSVSGGCVEGAVVVEAQEAMEDGKCRMLEYGVADEDAFSVGMACGGTIRILVEPIDTGSGIETGLLRELVAKRAARQPVAMLVDTQSWERKLVGPGDSVSVERFTNDKSGMDGDILTVIHNPPLRLIVVGAVHIAQALMPMARIAGYDATLVDPRDAFSSAQRFPGETLVLDWPDDALAEIGLDSRTAVVTLTHDPKLDDPAIRAALNSDVFYLGCLGSRKTHAKRLERLAAAGVSAGELSKIHAPVGADIGAKTPAEIAVSILAEISERLRRPETRP